MSETGQGIVHNGQEDTCKHITYSGLDHRYIKSILHTTMDIDLVLIRLLSRHPRTFPYLFSSIIDIVCLFSLGSLSVSRHFARFPLFFEHVHAYHHPIAKAVPSRKFPQRNLLSKPPTVNHCQRYLLHCHYPYCSTSTLTPTHFQHLQLFERWLASQNVFRTSLPALLQKPLNLLFNLPNYQPLNPTLALNRPPSPHHLFPLNPHHILPPYYHLKIHQR